ncbi:DUF5305 domain-containing protein [Candidatus Saccharibacteria bacterium]|nr:DUF5305 domain-containing protein [Candidatus Saccharibacteria bacterium]
MALNIDNPEHSYRPVGFAIGGLLLLMISGFIVYDVMQRKSDMTAIPSAYEYKVNQSVDTNVAYFNSSFYDATPGANTAFVSSLTDKVAATFHYDYHGSAEADLTYAYEVKALVRGNHIVQNDTKDAPSVWSKDIQLIAPKTETITSNTISLNPKVSVSYAEYKKQIEELKLALALPLSSSVTMQFIMKVSGTIGGTPFSDTRVSSVVAPIDEQIYTLSVKYDKFDTKQVVPQETKNSRNAFEQYETIITGVLAIVGLISLVYGFRKQIFKTAYQRELDRIYRFHDGIIIKASTETDMTGKNVVPVLSFDDMLNLEEELKLPIVASPAGGEATQFMIIRDDVAYVYVLGKVLLKDEDSISQIDVEDIKPPTVRRKK